MLIILSPNKTLNLPLVDEKYLAESCRKTSIYSVGFSLPMHPTFSSFLRQAIIRGKISLPFIVVSLFFNITKLTLTMYLFENYYNICMLLKYFVRRDALHVQTVRYSKLAAKPLEALEEGEVEFDNQFFLY